MLLRLSRGNLDFKIPIYLVSEGKVLPNGLKLCSVNSFAVLLIRFINEPSEKVMSEFHGQRSCIRIFVLCVSMQLKTLTDFDSLPFVYTGNN